MFGIGGRRERAAASTTTARKVAELKLAPRHGLEPRFTASKAAVLPLDDRGPMPILTSPIAIRLAAKTSFFGPARYHQFASAHALKRRDSSCRANHPVQTGEVFHRVLATHGRRSRLSEFRRSAPARVRATASLRHRTASSPDRCGSESGPRQPADGVNAYALIWPQEENIVKTRAAASPPPDEKRDQIQSLRKAQS